MRKIQLNIKKKDKSKIRIEFKYGPFIKNGILYLESVMEWNMRLDQRDRINS